VPRSSKRGVHVAESAFSLLQLGAQPAGLLKAAAASRPHTASGGMSAVPSAPDSRGVLVTHWIRRGAASPACMLAFQRGGARATAAGRFCSFFRCSVAGSSAQFRVPVIRRRRVTPPERAFAMELSNGDRLQWRGFVEVLACLRVDWRRVRGGSDRPSYWTWRLLQRLGSSRALAGLRRACVPAP